MASGPLTRPDPIQHPESSAENPESDKPDSSKLTVDASCTDDVQKDMKRGHGYAKVKPEYILQDYKPKLVTDYLPSDIKEHYNLETNVSCDGAAVIPDSNDESPNLTQDAQYNIQSSKRQKLKGRNKKRPFQKRAQASDKMCPSIVKERECNYGDKCKYNHDTKGYLEVKPEDLGERCFNFETFGMCHFGVTCRYGGSHLTSEGKNVVNEELFNRMKDKKMVTNSLSHDLKIKLWKKRYDFTKANKLHVHVAKNALDKQGNNKNKNNHDGQIVSDKINIPDSSEKLSSDKEINPELAGSANISSSSSTPGNNANSVNDDAGNNVQQQGSVSINTLPSTHNANNSAQSTAIESKASISHTDAKLSESTTQCLDKHSNVLSPQTQQDGQPVEGAAKDTSTDSPASLAHIGCGTDEGIIALRPQEKKMVDFRDKLYLAPLTTVGNLPFRRLCKTYGADITCGEMALSTNLLQGQMSEWALLKRHYTEDIFGVQVCGGFPDTLTRCSQLLNENIDVDFVDINCGCPIELIYQKGEGCALMGKVNRFEKIVSCMKSVLEVPLTVKMRIGIHDKKNIAHTLVPKLRDWGISMVTIHGRSREQRYTKLADWDYINMCAQAADPMPIYGNGDILSYEDAMLHRETTKVSGLMIARGALIKPWIFTEIKEQRHWDISATERLDILRDFVDYGMEHWGSDQQGVDTTRRFLLEWLSFLHRYIPVGLLEVLPQRINENPPRYQGRSDLETLFCSGNCADWIKISEMLLGPVPEGFTFLPKHKANAYQ